MIRIIFTFWVPPSFRLTKKVPTMKLNNVVLSILTLQLSLVSGFTVPFQQLNNHHSYPQKYIYREVKETNMGKCNLHLQSVTASRSMQTSRFMSSGVTENSKVESVSSTGLHHVESVEEIVNSKNKKYSTFLLDMWGVMHDGSKPYEGVLNTVSKLKEAGIQLVILSNSSKRLSHSTKMLTKLGFDPNDFAQIITSGEVAYQMLAGNKSLPCEIWPIIDEIPQEERKVFVFGSGDNDKEYCESCGWTLAPITEANLILARGTFTINVGNDDEVISKKIQGEEAYFKELDRVLNIAASRQLPMLISNPDKVRPDKGLPPMPGAIGDTYEEILGGGPDATELVKRIGKPFPEVYQIALQKEMENDGKFDIDQIDPSEACMVGDALETDVTGGSRIGCDTLWVINDGIHGPAIAAGTEESYEKNIKTVLDTFNDRKVYSDEDKLSPTFVVPHFKW